VVANGVFIAPSASVIGEVLLYGGSSVGLLLRERCGIICINFNLSIHFIWYPQVFYGAVLRGDKNKIILGSNSNVQDRAVISTVPSLESGFPADVKIGEYVTIGHGALITSSTIGSRVLIGQGAIIEPGCVIEDQTMIAAGAVVLPGTLVKTGELWAGNPATCVRKLSEDETKFLEAVSILIIS
jgi:carbonic anhydrase/acetyltransferase-like protein (isoleucine patch superfamily)